MRDTHVITPLEAAEQTGLGLDAVLRAWDDAWTDADGTVGAEDDEDGPRARRRRRARATGTTEGLEEQDREEARSERRRNGIGGGREERDDFVERDDARGERRPEDDEEGPVDVAEANGQHEDLPQRHRLRVAPHGRARG